MHKAPLYILSLLLYGTVDLLLNFSYDDDYYDKQAQAAWHDGQYENFEVRWTRDPEYAGAYRPVSFRYILLTA